MSLISCENVALSYENNIVVGGLNFEVNNGDYLCIVGENGSGKSTLVKSILGLKGIHEGKITFSKSISGKNIGYLPQQTTNQKDFPASVYEVVLSGCISEKKGIFFSKKQKERVLSNMERLNIKQLKNRCYRELSGGQQQRVLLARALCAADKLLLLDEPVAGLDPVVTADFYQLIEKLNHELGITIIMVSHDILYAATHASHILHMKKDNSFFGTSSQYLKSEVFKAFEGGFRNA
ncbi:MAG: ABC transporter ATP-binding protein [Faecalibacterium sp.]|nr:ABC transporter ATP-binding protein [Ruminococcus sp.]MCM1393068.1 ABC transporter ATP-binding protein [Ruminococcus sp.]MCM1484707.1 ABC transporter ATP-binding protein [Faecalibacterium sp.]